MARGKGSSKKRPSPQEPVPPIEVRPAENEGDRSRLVGALAAAVIAIAQKQQEASTTPEAEPAIEKAT